MFKIFLLLVLASCAKLNLKAHDKSGKSDKNSGSRFNSDKSSEDGRFKYVQNTNYSDRAFRNYSDSTSNSGNSKGKK